MSLADAVVVLADASPESTWTGTSTRLLEVLSAQVPALERETNWPESGAGLTKRLAELDDELRRRGLIVKPHRTGKERRITIRRP